MEKNSGGQEPDARPHGRGASRGQDDPRDAEAAGSGERARGSTEYAANAEGGRSAEPGHDEPGDETGAATTPDQDGR